jgi:hypothetical protein
VASDLAISDVLAELGFRSEAARSQAMAALVDAKLTSGHKTRIVATKRDAVRALLAARFVVVCTRASCRQALAASPRTSIDASVPTDCAVCGGAANEPAIDAAVEALVAHGLRRLLIVGGSPATHEELRALVGDRVDLRVVSGTDRHTGSEARGDLAWADLAVVWGSTQLDHKTSRLYTAPRSSPGTAAVVTCARRGIAALAATILEFTARRG